MKKLRLVSVVSAVPTEMTVFIQGIPTQLKLAWADGIVGCMPVFDDYDKAKEYCGGKDADIREVTVGDDYPLTIS